MHQRITQHVRGMGWVHYDKSGALQKKVTHYKKLVPKTHELVPETTNKNHCYCRPPQWQCGDVCDAKQWAGMRMEVWFE